MGERGPTSDDHQAKRVLGFSVSKDTLEFGEQPHMIDEDAETLQLGSGMCGI